MRAISDFDSIEQAIIDCGVEVPNGTPTSKYAEKIVEIKENAQIGSLDTKLIESFARFCEKGVNLATIPFLDTSGATNFSYMFSECSNLTTIAPLNTSKGTNFSYMFNDCGSLKTVEGLDTSKGTNLSYMFADCTALANFSKFDVSRATNISYAFSHCRAITENPMINTQRISNYTYAFYYSSMATCEIDVSNGKTFNNAFSYCDKLTHIKFLNMNTNNITVSVPYMFVNDKALTTIEGLDLTNCSGYSGLFNGCSRLKNLDVKGIRIYDNNFNVSQCTALTVESLLNILNALEDHTDNATTYTVQLGSTNLAKLTLEQKQVAYDKNYILI